MHQAQPSVSSDGIQLTTKDATNGKCIPFLKWAGGKRWLVPHIRELLPSGGVCGTYFEPFIGSGAIYFSLAPKKAILSDVNGELINTYQAIKKDWKIVLKHLRLHHKNHNKDYYYALRSASPRGEYTRAARFIYLNRTCWNGLYRVNKQGDFNVPKGTKTAVLLDTDNFSAIADILKDTYLETSDFEKQIDRATRGDVIFVDPPYTVKHKFNGFVKYNEQLFAWTDQVRLRNALVGAKARGARIIMTNADHESVRSLYQSQFEIRDVSRFSSIAGNGAARGTYPELLIIG